MSGVFDMDEAVRDRAPPVPMEAIRRVAAIVLKNCNTGDAAVPLQKADDFLRRDGGPSIFSGRIAYFDALMSVFPPGKSILLSRAGFANEEEAKIALFCLSWAATCERWCAAYAELQKLMGDTSKFAAMRAADFAGRWNSAKAKNEFKEVYAKGFAEGKATTLDVGAEHDPVVAATFQICALKPTIWHKDVAAGASIADPVPFANTAGDASWKKLHLIFNDKFWESFAYVDGVSMNAPEVFYQANTQLENEAKAQFPAGAPKPRRGVCPVGTEYRVKFAGTVVPSGDLDVALRAALRKYGKIESVTIDCMDIPSTFDAIPVDGSALW